MKFMHISDLHLGKRVNEFSMYEDQQYILTKIINAIDEEKPDGLFIAGDIYDKSIPTEEAVKLWDDFLFRLSKRNISVFVISGNHDSAVRLSNYTRLVESTGIHIAPVFDGKLEKVSMHEKNNEFNIYMLPFIKPASVRAFFEEAQINDYTDACRVVLDSITLDKNAINILLSHQFVTGATRCESEEIIVGGLDNVSAEVFENFDYVALGHIHGKQHIGRETIRYSGTPLKYSFSEKNHKKSITVVEISDKNNIEIREIMLVPLHDMREIKGTYEELTLKENYDNTNTDDYIHAILTDENDIVDAVGKLRVIYPNLMKLSYDNLRTRQNQTVTETKDIERKSPFELFEEFFEKQNNQALSEEQKNFTLELIDSIWEK